MQLRSPCRRCTRRKADKNDCVKDCNAIALYNRNSEAEYDEGGIIAMEKELNKLALEHVKSIEDKPEVKEIEIKEKVQCINPICDGNAMVRKGTGEPINGYCQACVRAGLSKKKKGTNATETGGKIVKEEKKKVVKSTDKSKELVLDLTGYTRIEELLTEMSDKMMLPREHIVVTLIGEALARRAD